MPVPPRAEQDQTVRYLDWQVSKINRLIAAKKKQISVLEELRTRLISDVVTGQIDVRDIDVPDFEYVNEETIDDSIEEELEENEEE